MSWSNIQPIEHELTQVTLRASYSSDRDGDTGELHRIVETAVKRFLDSIEGHPS